MNTAESGAQGYRPKRRPNIIYLMLDEWGYYEWSGVGHPILRTPNIDRVAAGGMRFTQALAGANVCAPTRSCLLTGQHTGHTTVRANGGGIPLRADDVTIGEVLKKAGYATGGFGKWGVGDRGTTGVPEKHGFDVFFGYYHQVHAHTYYPRYLLGNSEIVPLPGNTDDYLTGKTFSHYLIYDEAVKFIKASKDRPFFCYLPWTPPHGLWGIPADEPAWRRYKNLKWDATNQRGPQDAQIYGAMVEMVDRQLGEILQLLKDLKIDEDTIVFLSGDNGGQPYFRNERHPDGFFAPNLNPVTGVRFRGGKGNFYEGGLRIPFMVRWPKHIKPGRVSNHLCYFPDIMPTLAELAGGEPPENIDGISIVPTLLGEKAAGRKQRTHEYLYWEDRKSLAVRWGDYKAVKTWQARTFELYDLADDIRESRDVAAEHPDVVGKMAGFAAAAHSPVRPGKVLDADAGFKGLKRSSSSDQRYTVSFRYQDVTGIGRQEGICRRDPSDVVKVGQTYYVWYTKVTRDLPDGGKTANYPSGYAGKIWQAVSTDEGHTWEEKGQALGLGKGDDFDAIGVFTPNILVRESQYYLYYTAVGKLFVQEAFQDASRTAIGLAVSDSPDGPLRKAANNPILRPTRDPSKFDSFRVDDSCLILRDGKVWLYYKGRQWRKSPRQTKMGLAVADKPAGPYRRINDGDCVQDSGHEVLVWPYGKGVMSLVSNTGPHGRTLQYAADGVHFKVVADLPKALPAAPGAFRPDMTDSAAKGKGILWGVSMLSRGGHPYLRRYEIDITPVP